jgi:hypothetical protein
MGAGTMMSVGLFLVVSATIVGASLAASASASSGQRITDAKDGFSIVLPPGWGQVSLNGNDLGAVFGNAAKSGIKVNSSLLSEAKNAAAAHMKFIAVSSAVEDGGEFSPNMNVVVVPGTESTSLLSAQAKIGLTQLGARGVTTRHIQLGTGPALLATYSIPSTQAGATAINGAQVYAAHHGKTYIVSFTDATRSGSMHSESVMMSSWRYPSH